jgi:hypothetical protein
MPSYPPATIDGLRLVPCDPLILAVRAEEKPLRGLTGHVDWHLGGEISRLVAEKRLAHDEPILRPPHPLLPVGRLVLWRQGAATPAELARMVHGLKACRPGLCAVDFQFSESELRAALGSDSIIYAPPAELD